jgi:hypothetical protein
MTRPFNHHPWLSLPGPPVTGDLWHGSPSKNMPESFIVILNAEVIEHSSQLHIVTVIDENGHISKWDWDTSCGKHGKSLERWKNLGQ